MTRRVIFTPLAEAELADAIAWYEERSLRTSERFVSDENPYQYAALRGEARRAVVQGFPYILIYRISGDEVHVLGCFHTSRNPRRWRARLRDR
ncbi:MAG TPA: type II toxin-antitoxin system RelE/ParE family toxin [Caulobacteraceae bacterium]|nr:type II toxin-antitoxin system RelE/ParE family toxin [Caulobacteraceae bacterium]